METSSFFVAWPRTAAAAPALRAAALLAAAGAAALPLASAAGSAQVPPGVPAALALLAALATWRPAAGLAAAAALVPVSGWLAGIAGLPALRLAEALVLAVLAGAAARLALDAARRADRPPPAAAAGAAAALFIAIAAAALAVELAVELAGLHEPWRAAAAWLGAVAGGYLLGAAPPVPGLFDAARLMEGAALLLAVLAWSRRAPGLPRQLAAATLIGAAGAAAINLQAMLADLLAAGSTATPAAYLRGGIRLAAHVGDVNATGSYFLLAALTGLGLAAAGRAARPAAPPLSAAPTAAAALAALAACWLSGSRSAVAAALIVGLAAGAWWTWARLRGRLRLAAAGAVTAAALALPLAVVAAYPDRGGAALVQMGIGHRAEFTTRSLRMWATQPLFGVGAGRYRQLSEQFAGDATPSWLRRENAHNNFLQIAAELGAAGILAFLGLLAAGACRVRAGLGARPVRPARGARDAPDPLLAGAAAGAAAYLLTCLTGHPLLIGETAYPFWIVLALAVAQADRLLPPPRPGRRAAAAAWTAGAVLLATLPLRADAAVEGLIAGRPRSALDDLRGGTFGRETERPAGRRFRWSGPHATFLVPGGARAVRIPLRAPHARPGRPVTVDVALGGRPARRVRLPDGSWTDVPLPLAPPPPGDLHRIDLRVDPPWTPRERGNGDGRTLGVKVGSLVPGGVAPAPAVP